MAGGGQMKPDIKHWNGGSSAWMEPTERCGIKLRLSTSRGNDTESKRVDPVKELSFRFAFGLGDPDDIVIHECRIYDGCGNLKRVVPAVRRKDMTGWEVKEDQLSRTFIYGDGHETYRP